MVYNAGVADGDAAVSKTVTQVYIGSNPISCAKINNMEFILGVIVGTTVVIVAAYWERDKG